MAPPCDYSIAKKNVEGVKEPVINLNGVWKLNPNPPNEFWSSQVNPSSWFDAQVPCSVEVFGFEILADHEYAYCRTVSIPKEFSNKEVFLRFDGVSCFTSGLSKLKAITGSNFAPKKTTHIGVKEP
uniref:Uncharacterized protein n=1 Tax=Anaerolinea thermolimosa TaxID=229919 RepID=A0A7C4PJ39_9CHLR